MKVCILSTVGLKHMTMSRIFTEYFDSSHIEYDLVYIDKYGENEKSSARKSHKYRLEIERNWPFVKKLARYWGFRSFAKRIIEKEGYDQLVIWNSFTGLMFADFLLLGRRRDYCLNIRDYCYEKIWLVKFILWLIIKRSRFTTISSDKFRIFLPKHDYLMVHSYNEALLSSLKKRPSIRRIDEPLRISFIGYVRFFDMNKKLIEALGNDSRFILNFFGEGSDVVDRFAKENGFKNVICLGRFEPEQTAKLLENTDIINNLYGVGRTELDTALSIKLYYAVHMNIPILVFKDTYMDEIANMFSLGISIADKDFANLGNKIFDEYHRIDMRRLNEGCDAFLTDIRESHMKFKQALAGFIRN